ncbi:MAG TPA: sigma-70 family RNA polymerase sigma factor [Ilumatobacteraceae bacterium]
MDETGALAARFEVERPRLEAIAYRMLGSRAEAEDAVQDAWLRLGGTDVDRIDNLGGWLTTVTARVCLDRLRSRRSKAEESLGARPHDDVTDPAVVDPAQDVAVADSVGAALLVVLDTLPPAERVAFVLHDVFAVPFDEIAEIVERTPEAARQLASRGRNRVRGASPAARVDPLRHRKVVEAFLRAARGGDFDGLLRVLDPDVVLRPDAAALRMGSLRETHGARDVAGALSGGAQSASVAIVDGIAALVWAPGGRVRGVIEFTVVDDQIAAIDVTGDTDRIDAFDIVVLDQ